MENKGEIKTLNDLNLDLIKKWEGLKLNAYKCSAGVWTVGYGSTFHYDLDREVQEGDTVTLSQADKFLCLHVKKHILPKLSDLDKKYGEIPTKLKESLISLAYNVGQGCLDSQNFLAALKNKSEKDMAHWFSLWKHANGKVIQGLVNRRKDEVAHFEGIWKSL